MGKSYNYRVKRAVKFVPPSVTKRPWSFVASTARSGLPPARTVKVERQNASAKRPGVQQTLTAQVETAKCIRKNPGRPSLYQGCDGAGGHTAGVREELGRPRQFVRLDPSTLKRLSHLVGLK